MKISRLFRPLFVAFALLTAQQVGAAHVVAHALEQAQHDQHSSPSTACEKCEGYAQLGSALSVSHYDVPLISVTSVSIPQPDIAAPSLPPVRASARGPPLALQALA